MSISLVWFIGGVGCMLLELASPMFIIFFLGLGAWAASFAMYLGASLAMSFGVFSVVSVASLAILRRVLIKTLRGSEHSAKDLSSQPGIHVGKQAVVSKAIMVGGVGEISLGGSYWRAALDATASSVHGADASLAHGATASSALDTKAPSAPDTEALSAGLEIGRAVVVSGHDPDDAILLRVRAISL